jgi:hypothetical protein
MKVYQEVQRKEQRNERISKNIGKLDPSLREAYRKENPYEKINPEERTAKRYVSHLITKKTHFLLAVPPESENYNRVTYNRQCDVARFSKSLLKACMYQLVEFMRQFEVKELPQEEAVRRLIQEYNRTHMRKIPEVEMIRFYVQLLKIGSFKEAGKIMQISRATLFRYKDRFRKIGIRDNNLIPLTPDGLPDAPLDFRRYHEIVTYSNIFRYKNTLFQLDL